MHFDHNKTQVSSKIKFLTERGEKIKKYIISLRQTTAIYMLFVRKYFNESVFIVKDLFSAINADRSQNHTVYIQLNKYMHIICANVCDFFLLPYLILRREI